MFKVTVDGVEIASFSELQGITTKVDVVEAKGRSLLAHELTHAVQQRRASDGHLTVRLKKPDADKLTLRKLWNAKGRKVRIVAENQRGVAIAAVEGRAAAGGNDVMQQEWTITYETIQRVL